MIRLALVLLTALVLGLTSACAVGGHADRLADRVDDPGMSNRAVREWVTEYRRSLVSEARTIALDAYSGAPDWRSRQEAMAFGLFVGREASRAGGHADGIVALIDLWTLVRQLQAYFTVGDGAEALPEHRDQLLVALSTYDAEAQKAMDRLGDEDLAAEADDVMQRWVEEWPIRGERPRRVSTIPLLTTLHARRDGSVLDTVASMEETAERIEDSVNDLTYELPAQIALNAAMLVDHYLEMAENGGLPQLLERAVVLLESIPAWGEEQRVEMLAAVDAMRDQTLAAISAERALAFDELDRQRRATIEELTGTLATERSIALDVIGQMRVDTVAAIRDERIEMVDQVEEMRAATLERAEASAAELVEGLLDGLLWRVLLVVAVAGVGLFAIVWFVLRRVAPA